MTRIACLCSASVLTFCAAIPACAGAARMPTSIVTGAVHQVMWYSPGITDLYYQNSDDAGVGINSQNFSSGTFSTYNSAGADDFAIPAGHKWKIREVDVTGTYFHGSGPASSENVCFYKNNNGLRAP